jgi:hypothetical protein
MRPRTLPRLRVQVVRWPRRAVAVIDTPRPGCLLCHGNGGHGGPSAGYDDPEGWHDHFDFELCTCWNSELRIVLLPLPHIGPDVPPPL